MSTLRAVLAPLTWAVRAVLAHLANLVRRVVLQIGVQPRLRGKGKVRHIRLRVRYTSLDAPESGACSARALLVA